MEVSKNKKDIDLSQVINYLVNQSYWAKNRSEEKIRKSIDNSLCFSLLDGKNFAGFARIVTDYTTFSYLCDFFILPLYQNKKYGSFFLQSILEDEAIVDTLLCLLTKTAHEFYKKFGFDQNDNMLQRVMFK